MPPKNDTFHAIGDHGACVVGLLERRRVLHERQRPARDDRADRGWGEVEVDGLTVRQPQCERGSAIQHVARRHRVKLRPERELRRGKDREVRGHGGNGLAGSGGGGRWNSTRCQKFHERASRIPGDAAWSASRNASSPRSRRARRTSSSAPEPHELAEEVGARLQRLLRRLPPDVAVGEVEQRLSGHTRS